MTVKLMTLKKPTRALFCAAATAYFLVGCASTDPEAVSRASKAVESAASSPLVQQYAPVELAQARDNLAKARSAEQAEAEHFAYLAGRQAEIAMNRASARASTAQVEELGRMRSKILADAAQQRASRAEQRAREAAERARQQRAKNAQLREQLTALKTQETDRGLVVTLSGLLFEVDGAQLQAGGRRHIAQVAELLRDRPGSIVRIEGHTDSTGASDYNRQLSQRRAQAVREALVAEGVDPQRIRAVGLGEDYPVATNDTAAGRQQNRRVDVVVQSAEAP